MPELPEVETQVRALRRAVLGARITEVWADAPRLFWQRDISAAQKVLPGQTLRRISRHGKNIIMHLDHNVVLAHLGMTGHFLIEPTNKMAWHTSQHDRFVRIALRLHDHRTLLYSDIRKFGRFYVVSPQHAQEYLDLLGPDPLALTLEAWLTRLGTRRGAIKPLLLNQFFVAGIGNIYADEALHMAQIHPQTLAEKLTPRERRELYATIQKVLRRSIALGGSSFRDFVDPQARAGRYQKEFRVYSNTGRSCPRRGCGGIITKIVLGGRGTHFCSHCQRKSL